MTPSRLLASRLVQRGTALPIALVMVTVMAMASIGLVRMIDSSTLLARNASFQRDAVNRNQIAIRTAIGEFEAEAGKHFAMLKNTEADALGQAGGFAYSAIALPTDSAGVPLAIKDDASFVAAFGALASTSAIASGEGMQTVYLIERLCSLQEPAADNHCAMSSTRVPDNCSRCSSVSTPRTPVFRVTARTNGPRGVEALSQALFTLPIE